MSDTELSKTAYREAVSDALAARDEHEPVEDYLRRQDRCVEIIARHKNLTPDESRAWIEEKRMHGKGVDYNGDHVKGWLPGQSLQPKGREIWTREGKMNLPFTLSSVGLTREERVMTSIEDYVKNMGADIKDKMRNMYIRAYRRLGLLRGNADEIGYEPLPPEPGYKPEKSDDAQIG